MDTKTGAGLLLARLGLGAIFLLSGLGKLSAWSGTVAYAASAGVPAVLLAGATALELCGAVSLLLGWRARLGAVALLVFLVPVTLVFHAFWAAHGPEAQMQTIQFLKNVAIGGGLFSIVAVGPGTMSLDALFRRAHPNAANPARAAA